MEGPKTLSESKRYHSSVLLDEAVDALEVSANKWYLDLTLGDGGHTVEIIRRGGRVVGIDVDPQALLRVQKRLKELGIDGSKYRLIQGNFRDFKKLILRRASPAQDNNTQTESEIKFAGAIFDLGVSSLQLESPERGFSFTHEGPLDMRMDPTLGVRAVDLINAGRRKELYELFKNLGEEKYSWRLADALVRAREIKPITTTTELAEVVVRVVGSVRGKIHPATKVFQALRIAVNDELNALKEGLDQAKDLVEGLVVVISFHSLEDRIVKNAFREWESKGLGQILTKKPMVPSEQEIAENPRSRSAKMRVFKRD